MSKDIIRKAYLFILALLFLAVSHITIRNFGAPLVLPVAYFIWITVSGLILLTVIHIFNEWKFILPSSAKYILLFLFLLLLPALFNPIINSHAFMFQTAGLIGGIIFFISLHQFELTEDEKEMFINVIFLSGFIEALISLHQYFNPGTGIFLIAVAAAKVIYGNFQHQNLLASYIATSLVISLYMLTGSWFKEANRWLKGVFYLMVLLICFILFLTGSRAGVIEAGVGAVILLAARFRHYRVNAVYPVLWLVVIVIGAGGSFMTERYYHGRETALSTVGKKFEMTVESVTGEEVKDTRIPMYLTAINMIKERPLTGHGPGNFSSRFMHYRSRLAVDYPEYPYEAIFTTHPHNEILYRTVESGLPAGAGLLMVGVVFIVYMVRLGRERGGAYAALLFPITFHTQVGYPLYQSMPHWVLFILLLYLPSSHFIREVRIRSVSLLRTVVLTVTAMLFVLVTYFSITTLNAQRELIRYRDYLMIRNIIRTELLMPSLDNLYLSQVGERLLADAKLRVGLMSGDRKLLEEFVGFSRYERQVFPHSTLYKREARALFDLGRKKEAYMILDEGYRLYPGKKGLVETEREFIVEDIEEAIRRKMDQEGIKDD